MFPGIPAARLLGPAESKPVASSDHPAADDRNAVDPSEYGLEDVVMAAAHESAQFAARAESSNVGPHTLEQLEAENVVEAADDLSMAALELVGGRPGGADRPVQETQTVAAAIHRLHALGRRRPEPGVPSLTGFLQEVVIPRIRQRAQDLDLGSHQGLVREACQGLVGLRQVPTRTTILHADLYAENVLFDARKRPHLIDPHPVEGDAVFDWAFWSVYYDLERGMADRLATAARISRIPVPEITPWCRAPALDGLLYYREIHDPAEPKIATVLASLMASGAGSDR